ncbi:MAG: hypothetical protein QXD43_04375 [Candidatus Aenigmatarchaeota archaeon]
MFGFNKKQIDVFIEKFNFSPGEVIKGKVILNLNKPIHAKALKVGLRGEKIVDTTTITPSKVNVRHDKACIFNFEMPLEGEKDFLKGEYDFEIKVPTNLSQNIQLPSGVIGDFLKSLYTLANAGARFEWYIIAYLDIPMGIDVSKKVQVNIIG